MGSDDEMGFESISEPDDASGFLEPEDDSLEGKENQDEEEVHVVDDEDEDDVGGEGDDSQDVVVEVAVGEEEGRDTPSPSLETSVHEGGEMQYDADADAGLQTAKPLTPDDGVILDIGDAGRITPHDDEGDPEEEDVEEEEEEWVDQSSPILVQRSLPAQEPLPLPQPPPPPPLPLPPPLMVKTEAIGRSRSRSRENPDHPSSTTISQPPSSASTYPVSPTQNFPFPRSATAEDLLPPQHAQELNPLPTDKLKRMHNARARDGGRTQSGGVKGVFD
jgi:cysteine protease ATG4